MVTGYTGRMKLHHTLAFTLFFIAHYDVMAVTCADFSLKLPNTSQKLCQAAQLQDSKARSVKGQPLYTRDVLPPDSAGDETGAATGTRAGATKDEKARGAKTKDAGLQRVLVVGGIHGDELSSSALALHWIALAEQIPARTHWRFIPALNPDGLLVSPARRTNANGVDLNRNFPTPRWSTEAPAYWEKRTRKDPRRWPGHTPLSEPESRFLHAQMQEFKPHLIVSIHAPYGVLDFDGPFAPPTKLGRLYLDQVGIFPGSLGNYGGVHLGMPVVTIELPSAFRTPLPAEMRQMWLDLLRWKSERLGEKPSN